jgi:hypothetical protein
MGKGSEALFYLLILAYFALELGVPQLSLSAIVPVVFLLLLVIFQRLMKRWTVRFFAEKLSMQKFFSCFMALKMGKMFAVLATVVACVKLTEMGLVAILAAFAVLYVSLSLFEICVWREVEQKIKLK